MGPRILQLASLLAATAIVSACGSLEATARRTIERYVGAVQDQDLDALHCLLAGASRPDAHVADRAGFDAWVGALYDAYGSGRDAGGVELDGEGLLLTKAFALGRGAFYAVDRTRSVDGTLIADTTVRFGYGRIDYSRFSPGTTFYLAAAPPGRIEAVRVPFGNAEIEADVLERVTVRWTLVRQPETADCPARWAVLSVEADPASTVTTRIAWRF